MIPTATDSGGDGDSSTAGTFAPSSTAPEDGSAAAKVAQKAASV